MNLEQRLDYMTRDVSHTLAQCRRFRRLAATCRFWAAHWPTDALARRLTIDGLAPPHYQIALVALALQATGAAGDAIAAYDPGDDFDQLLFYAVVQTEWEQRYHDSPGGDPHQSPA